MAKTVDVASDPAGSGQPFDLDIERVLEHCPVANALREFIALSTFSGSCYVNQPRLGPNPDALSRRGR